MLKKIGFILLCSAAALAPQANASMNHSLQAGITIEYDLPPHDAQLFTNYMFWIVEANCKMTTEDESNELLVQAVSKKGKINDIPLSKGESIRLTIHNGDVLKLSADPGAKVEITNEGEHNVKAICTS